MTPSLEEELCYLAIADLQAGYQEKRFSPVDVAEAHVRRIEAVDGALHSYITVTADVARAAARRAEARHLSGSPKGPLDGIPFAVKDIFDTAGIRTTANSRQFLDRIPKTDAAVVRRLVDAGAVLLGKQTTYEFAAGTPATDSAFPPARNPWNTGLIPGGSSSGSAAAVAAGLAPAAFGTDTGGSIRGPASYCGTVGFKPSCGLVSRTGVVPLSWTLDQVGPLTRTVEDTAILLQATAGREPDFGTSRPRIPDYRSELAAQLHGRRLGVPLKQVQSAPDLHLETMEAYRVALAVFERLGADVQEVTLPEYESARVVVQALITAEAFAYHKERAHDAPQKFGAALYRRLLQGALLTASDYIDAQRGRALIVRAMRDLMRSIDFIVLPTTPHPACTFEEDDQIGSSERSSFTQIFNLSGQPAMTVPCGFTSSGLPIGLQVVGRVFEDSSVLAAAHAYEQATGWSSRRPPLTFTPR